MAGLSSSATFNHGLSPQVREREDFFDSQTVRDLNTYSTWDEVQLTNDVTDDNLVVEGEGAKAVVVDKGPKEAGYGVKSIFNKWTVVPVLDNDTRIKLNVPLVDTSETRRSMRETSNPSIKKLVEASREGLLGRETYDYSDFMYCKHLGKMSNNYLITLRRFPIACNDYIGQLATTGLKGEEREIAVPLGCLVTWMGTPGNEMTDILKYTFHMPFKEMDAQLEDKQYFDLSTPLGNMFAAFDTQYLKQVQAGQSSVKMENFAKSLGLPWGNAPYTENLMRERQDANKIYGPIDVVKKTSMRDNTGLSFEHSFNLRFEYELRSYSNINTRQAMLDLIGNILTVTYTNGAFWRGGYKGFGHHQSDIFSNLKIMQNKGGVTGFIDAFASDINMIGSSIKSNIKKQGGFLETLKNLANNFGGMLLGGMLNSLGRPQKQAVNSLLSPAPVGLWHVTVGNPFHPIMSIGNLILEDTTITHQGPLGLDDFPTKLIVDCKLKRAKGRDSNMIEMLYNQGAVRIYSGLESETLELIKKAPNYGKDSGGNLKSLGINKEIVDLVENPKKMQAKMKSEPEFKGYTSKEISNAYGYDTDAMTRYWQTHDKDAVLLAGKEWLRGAGKKNKTAKT